MNSTFIFIIIICLLVLLGLYIFRKHFKLLNIPCVFLISGAVKSGKSMLSVHIAIKEYKRSVRQYYVKKFFYTILGLKKKAPLKPMLYSNIPLAKVPYNILSKDIILQKVRIPNKSVVLLDEASLLADSMLFKDKDINNRLLRFVKLFGHYSHNGKLIINTQSISDLHFSFKRCISNYLYVYKRLKLPIFSIMWVREMMYSEDNSLVNFSDKDMELTLRKVLIFNNTVKKYDSCCYSIFTDDLPYYVQYDIEKKDYNDDLKVHKLVSFHDFAKEINEYMENKENEVIENEEK